MKKYIDTLKEKTVHLIVSVPKEREKYTQHLKREVTTHLMVINIVESEKG